MTGRLAELEEENAWLKSELGLQRDTTRIAKLHKAMLACTPRGTSGWRGAAEFVAALYDAKGRVVTHAQLLEIVPAKDREERDPKIISIWAYMARKALGKDAVQTDYGKGYQLSPQGMKDVGRILR